MRMVRKAGLLSSSLAVLLLGGCQARQSAAQKSRPASSSRSGLAHFFSSAVQLFTKVKSDIDPPPIGIGKSMRLPSRVM